MNTELLYYLILHEINSVCAIEYTCGFISTDGYNYV